MILLKRKKLISLPRLLKRTQVVFNAFIRDRDIDKGCISCGARVTEAGHYYAAGHYTGLRFSETNTNGQCTRCNCFMHGNLIHYRSGIIHRYGEQALLLLESSATRNKLKRWSRGELEIIIQMYSKGVSKSKLSIEQ